MNLLTKPLLLVPAALALSALPASATIHNFTINITVDQEVPVPSGGTGSGSGTATYDDVTGEFTWNYSFAGLSGAVTAAHFHGAALPGVNTGVQVVIDSPTDSPNMGMAMIDSNQGADLIGGLWYLNIHTDTVPSGEIRGQVLLEAPTDNSALIKALKKKIKKFTNAAKQAKKRGQHAKARRLLKKAKKLKAKLKKL